MVLFSVYLRGGLLDFIEAIFIVNA